MMFKTYGNDLKSIFISKAELNQLLEFSDNLFSLVEYFGDLNIRLKN